MTNENGSAQQFKQALEKGRVQSRSDEPIRLGANLPKFQMREFSDAERAEMERQRSEREAANKLEWTRSFARAMEGAWQRAGIPARHMVPFNPKPGPWSDCLDKLVSRVRDGSIIALLGERGTGKTQLASQLIYRYLTGREAPERRSYDSRCYFDGGDKCHAMYVRMMEIFIALRASYRKEGPTEDEQIAKFVSPGLLVIDEAQERGESDWENRLLAEIIDHRYGDMSDTLIISNQKPDEFKASIGPSIYSRLVETGGIIVCDWPSFRTGKGAA